MLHMGTTGIKYIYRQIDIVSNDKMTKDDKLERKCKEVVVTYFRVLFRR
jgi:hypothetical protein